MRKSIFWIGFFLLVLLMASLACFGEEEPTATPVAPTQVPASPTPPPATATPEPLSSLEAPELEMISAESDMQGVRFCYPDGWFYADSFFIFLSSDSDYDMFAAEDELPDGVAVIILAGSAEELAAEDFSEDMFAELAQDFGGEDVELVGDFEETIINGADVKMAEFRATVEGDAVYGIIAVYLHGEQASVVVALSPEELWEENAASVDAILECIELYDGVGLDFEMDVAEVPVWHGELTSGETVQDEFDGGEIHSWTFSGAAGDLVTVVLTPLGDEMDLSFQLLDPDGDELVDVDDAFSGEAETLSDYELSADGEFTLLVQEFWKVPGEYELQLLVGDVAEETGKSSSGEMIAAESEIQGVRMAYPDGWFYDDTLFLIVASDPAAMTAMGGDVSDLDAVLLLVIAVPAEEMEGESFESTFDEMGDMFGAEAGAEAEMIGDSTQTTINGADVEMAEFRITGDELTAHTKFAIFNNGEQAAVVLALGPEDLWSENASLVDAIIESIELFEGSGFDFGEMPAEEGEYRGSLAYNDVVDDEFAGANSHIWTFEGSAGDYVTVIMTPLGEDMDVTIQLRDADLTVLTEVDDEFSDEGEVLQDYQLPADGEYQIIVEEYWGAVGPYQLELLGGEEPIGDLVPQGSLDMGQIVIGEPIAGLLLEAQVHVWTLPAQGGEVVNLVATPLSDEVDLTVTVIAPDGSTLFEEYDEAFSGAAEELSDLELSMPGDYLVMVKEYWDEGGSYTLAVDLSAGE